MEFKLSNRQRYLFITSTTFLILCSILQGISQSVTDSINFNWAPIIALIFAASYSYVLFIFITYFRFYALPTLTILTSIILVTELVSTFLFIINLITTLDLEGARTVINILTIIVEIIWLFYLFPLKNKDCSAILSLYKYGIAIVVTFFIAIVVMFNLVYSENLSIYGIQDSILAIPYLFLIDFALKLNKSLTIKL